MINVKNEFLWFVSAPLRPEVDETIKGNALHAAKIIRVLEKSNLCVTAPYLGIILGDILDDRSKEERERGMQIDLQVLRRCDGNILIGDRLSSGMQGEAEYACRLNKPVYNLVDQDLEEVYTNAKLLKKYEMDVMNGIGGMFGPEMFKW